MIPTGKFGYQSFQLPAEGRFYSEAEGLPVMRWEDRTPTFP